jgi:hypothetical protein
MEGADHRIPKEENAYFSFKHEAGIRRDLVPNNMIHLRIPEYHEVYVHIIHWN